jgi:uncharacterized protein YjbJ (UPF0337 family)
MGIGDKISNAAEELKGKVKETAGNATDNEELEADGKLDQAKANLNAAAAGRRGRAGSRGPTSSPSA